ncbi:MAG: hypothetical protein GX158_05440 [Bacteroidales bacterium]|nr:hypothetical protein [Bacteroidales bacterium]
MDILKLRLNDVFKPASQILIFLMLIGALAGCSKNETEEEGNGNGNGNYFLKVKIDGQWVEFTSEDVVEGTAGPSIHNYSFGLWGSSPDEVITIVLEDENPVSTGTYSGLEKYDNYTLGVIIAYVKDQGDSNPPDSYVTDPDEAHSILTITHLSDKEAKGTFAGTLINPITKDRVTLTEGSFLVKMARVF